jgi:capsular exopolysaccharide synthesis family protein
MSKFRQALEQARRDRAVQTAASPDEARAADVAPPKPSVVDAVRLVPPEPSAADGVDDHLVSLVRPASLEAEQYRTLRHLLEQARSTRRVHVVAVSSPGAGDGKTITAINTAGALAQARTARVLLVDADLRNAAVAHRLGLADAGRPGLVEAILDPRLGLEDVVQPLPAFNLHVVPAGSVPISPYEVLKSPRLGDVLRQARRAYDHVVLDTAPLVPNSGSRLIAEWVDGILLVVAAHKTRSGQLGEALGLLDPTRLLGLVFNVDEGP